VPQVLVWHRDPDRTRSSILDDFFGDPSAPGRLRKLVSFVLNHRRAQVRTAEPINLQQFLRDHRHVSDEVVLTEQLRVAIARAMAQEDRVIRGAPIKPPAQVRREILEDPDVQSDLVRLAQETGKSSDAVRREADANLSEIAAKYTMNMVAFLSFLLALLWAKIYDGIEVDEDGLERIRQAGRQSPLVVVPSHKSHIDYLVISYIFYTYGLIPPHIAAGANLSFFPLGWIFRRGGAFFLRRSFHGQPIYAAAFRHYVRKLLADGHWLEFFPEGGRSRTGKLLPPKFGLIKHVLEAVADGVRDDVQFVPANFGYERLIEEKAYRKELEGGEKKSESPVEVLKATRVLVHKYGSIRIQFGQPMSVRALLEEFGAMGRAGVRDAAAFDAAVKVCGYRILGGINQAAVLTPTALTAAVLLTKTRKGILKRDLLLRVGYLLDLAVRRGAVLSEPLVTALQVRRQQILEAERRDQLSHAEAGGTPDPFGLQAGRARAVGEAVADVIDKALQLFESSRWVLLRRFGDEDVYIVRAEGRMHLDYYKNNMLHLFVPEALLATAILAKLEDGPSMAPHDLQDMTKFLSRMLKFEFVYEPGVGFEQQYTQTLADFIAAGWLVQRGHGDLVVASQVRGALRMYAKLLQSFVESYALMADAVRVLGKGPVSEAAFFDSVQIEAQKAFDLGTVECYEAVSKVNLTNALQIFREQGFVTVTTDGSGKKRVKLLGLAAGPEPAARFAAFVAQLRRLQGPWLLDRQ
jgi:glycerol-3-phosphate O-acyltransferase